MKKGLIMIGYQGIGKSSCAGKNGCIDLESSTFWFEGSRLENWYIPYCNIAMDLANQGYTVFTSSHKVVREQLASMPLMPNVGKVVIFCPETRFKKEWIQRLQDRYNRTGLTKDYKALANAKERFTENIFELINSGLPVYCPAHMDYDLMNYVCKARNDWCWNDEQEMIEADADPLG